MGIPLLGHVVPHSTSIPNVRRSFVTNVPYGPPIEEAPITAKPMAPRPTGDERSPQILQQLQKLLGTAGSAPEGVQKPITETLPANRDWR